VRRTDVKSGHCNLCGQLDGGLEGSGPAELVLDVLVHAEQLALHLSERIGELLAALRRGILPGARVEHLLERRQLWTGIHGNLTKLLQRLEPGRRILPSRLTAVMRSNACDK